MRGEEMKKLLITIILILIFPIYACAMGPIYTGPKIATWDASVGATGYYIYWRTPGTTPWVNTQRVITTATTLDLVSSGLPQGEWEICATAFNTVSESGPSNVVAWSYIIVPAPTNTRIPNP